MSDTYFIYISLYSNNKFNYILSIGIQLKMFVNVINTSFKVFLVFIFLQCRLAGIFFKSTLVPHFILAL